MTIAETRPRRRIPWGPRFVGLTIAVARGLKGVWMTVALAATFAGVAVHHTVRPLDFFGYFTIQSSVGAVVVLSTLAVTGFRGRPGGRLFSLFRAVVTVDMVLSGVLYAFGLVQAGAGNDGLVPWANTAIHVAGPLFFVLDWFILGGRPVLSWRSVWIVLIHPAVWLVVVLLRGWVPYPFLRPELGVPVIAASCALIAGAFVGIGALVWWSSRWCSVLGTTPRGDGM